MEIERKLFTLAFIIKDSRILLGMKKRGFGANRYNGFGGKVEVGKETIREATQRELQEECGVTAVGLRKVGELEFTFDPQHEKKLLHLHVYLANEYTGEVTESDEMAPEWFDLSAIPFRRMWPDDQLWFPHLLSNQNFVGRFQFSDFETILHYSVDLRTQFRPDE
eukprot:ANDGO_02450.mRNA.1 7